VSCVVQFFFSLANLRNLICVSIFFSLISIADEDFEQDIFLETSYRKTSGFLHKNLFCHLPI